MTPKETRSRSLRMKGAFTILAFTFWGVVTTYAIHGGMRPNPITLPLEDVNLARTLLPEGWGFFTKNAEEENPFFYAHVGGEWVPAIQESPYSPRYLLGANRTGRYRGVEMGLITAAVGKKDWSDCNTDPLSCVGTLTPLVIGPIRDRGTLCGELGLVQQAPVPWAWARSPRPVVMPSKVARVIVSC